MNVDLKESIENLLKVDEKFIFLEVLYWVGRGGIEKTINKFLMKIKSVQAYQKMHSLFGTVDHF